MKVDKRLVHNNNSLLVRIPKKFAKELKMEFNEIIEVELRADKIIITKKKAG